MAEPILKIEYKGNDAAADAAALWTALKRQGLAVDAPRNGTSTAGELGIAEIILTVVLTGAAKASAKVVIKYLREYLTTQLEAADSALRVRVDLSKDDGSTKKLPFLTKKMTLETIDVFCANIEKAVEAL